MNEKILPGSDHICRYCKPRDIDEGEILPTAFHLKEKEEYLSTQWLEFFSEQEIDKRIDLIRNAFELSLSRNGKIAVLNIGDIKKNLKQKKIVRAIIVKSIPTLKNPSYAGIFGYHFGDNIIASLLAEVINRVYPTGTSEVSK